MERLVTMTEREWGRLACNLGRKLQNQLERDGLKVCDPDGKPTERQLDYLTGVLRTALDDMDDDA